MSTNIGKKNIAHKGSGHGVVAPAAMSLLTPPAPPVPTPFPYTARSANASDTASHLKIGGNEVLVDGSTMALDPPANQPAQSGGGDVVTHATKNVAVMTMGSMCLTVGGKGICATGDIAALNVLTKQSKVAQMQLPLLEAGDFDTASKSSAAAAKMNRLYRRAYPPTKANQCRAGHPVDLGTGYIVDDAVDLVLPGFVPLLWSRSYSSAAPSHRGAMGKGGWTHSFEQWIEETETGFRYHDHEGLPVEFARGGEDGLSFHRGRRLELRQSGRSFEIYSLVDRYTRTFSPLPSGRIVLRTIRDSRLHQIQIEHDGERLTRLLDSVGREIRVTSDEKGRVARVEVWASDPDSDGAATLQSWFDYGYHPEGELASQTNALGHAEAWEYDGFHRMIKATLRSGVSFYYEYHPELGHCVRTWGDDGLHDVRLDIDFEKGETRTHGTNRARRYFWKNGVVFREETFGGEWAVERLRDEDELLVSVKNGAGEETTYEHDARGNLIQETDPAGNVSTWEIHDDLPARHLGPTGLATTYAHDHRGSLLEVTYPTGLSYRFELDREGRVAAIFGADGVRAKLGYDGHSNLRTDTSSRGATTTYRYDALGRPAERTDALGRRMRIRYDLMGRVLERVRPDGTSVLASYDRQGNLASTTDALGQITRMEHAGTGHLARLIQADGQVFRFTYDSDERLVQILNPRLEKYEFEYDRADQIVGERTFDNQLLTYRYSRSNRLTRIDYPEGEWRELSHDKLGNVLEDRSSDVQVAFTRDALGRVEKAISKDVTGQVVTELERDGFGRLTADIQDGRAVRYEYDARGHRCARILPDGERTDYRFDHDDAFLGVTHAGRTVTLERDKLGRERGRSAAGWKLEREHDAMDRLLSQKVVTPEPGAGVPRILAQRRYAYDSKGRVTSIDSPHGGLTLYRYDRVDQLIEASRGSVQEVFEYDPAGSLTGVLGDLADLGKKAAWSLAAGNRLKSTDRAQYINDGRGRRIQRIERTDGKDPRENPPRGDELVTTYGWDSYDRLREVVLPGGSRARYTYDAFGRRVQKDVLPPPVDLTILLTAPPAGVKAQSRRTVHFLWDGEVLCEERDSARDAASQKRVHVHEPGTFTPMLQAEQGDVFGVIVDHLGTPRELVDSAGKIAWRAAHSAWGKVVEVARDDGAASVESPFRFQGQYADAETGLCCTRFRYFEADTGRWLSPDPLGFLGGNNLLGFGGCPTLVTDPLGLACTTGFETNPNEAFFWSGRSPDGAGGHKGGQHVAAEIATAHGGTTLEMMIAQRGIVLPPWDASNPAVVTAWKDASRSFAEGVSGTVHAVIGSSLRPDNVWETAELPALRTNPNVTKIVQIDPVTGVHTTVFER